MRIHVCLICTDVQIVLANPQHIHLGDTQLVVKEYYPFMELEETDTAPPTQPIVLQPYGTKYIWSKQRKRLSPGRYNFAKRGLYRLNQILRQIKASALLESGQTLCISPSEKTSSMSDWENKANELLDKYFADCYEDVVQIAKEAKAEVLSFVFAEDRRPLGVDVSLQGERLSVSGSRDQVQKVLDEIHEMVLAAQVSTKDINFSRKHIRFLVKLCSQEMNNVVPTVQFEPLFNQAVIRVTTNPFKAFEQVVEDQLKTVNEAKIVLSPDLHQLFSSARGEEKIAEVAGIQMPKMVYDFEATRSHDAYFLCILSRDKETCRSVHKQLCLYAWSKAIEVNQKIIRACTDKKWRELEHKLTSEHFVVISVHPEKNLIIVGGEMTVLDDIIKRIEKFLRDHISVEDLVKVDANVWNIVNLKFTTEMSAIDSDAKSNRLDPTIFVRKPKHVDGFKVQAQILFMNFHHKEAKAEVLSYVFSEDRRPSGVDVSLQGECLSVSGSCDQVQKVLDEIHEMMFAAQVSTKDINLPKKHIRFLVKFCSQKMNNVIPTVQFEPLIDQAFIRVTTNPFKAFEQVIENQLRTLNEATIALSPDLHQLFSSARGEAKIAEVAGIEMPKIVYDFEATHSHDEYILCILSRDKETCKSVHKKLGLYAQTKVIEVTQQKIQACANKEWRELEHKLTSEHFVVISIYPEKNEIIVGGEVIVLDDIINQIEECLQYHTSVVKVNASVWNVVNLNFTTEMNVIDSNAKSRHVDIVWPKSSSQQDPTVLIRGEPKLIGEFKVQVQKLFEIVHHKKAIISKVPALVHVLESMGDQINVLQTKNRASIVLHFVKGTAEESQAMGELPRNLCSATTGSGFQVNVYIGDFTLNQPVTAILNFVSLNPHVQNRSLKLLASVAGQEMEDDFIYKQPYRPGLIFQTKHGQLKCSQLLHCFLPPWNQGTAATGMQYLTEGLKDFLRISGTSSSVLITPVTSKPLEYPTQLFAEKLLEVCSDQDIQVTVYVDEIEQARVFEEILTNRKFIVHTHMPVRQTLKSTTSYCSPTCSLTSSRTSSRATSNQIKSFISLTQGNILKQKVNLLNLCNKAVLYSACFHICRLISSSILPTPTWT